MFIQLKIALVQRMADFLLIWLKSRLFETLSCSVFFNPTLRKSGVAPFRSRPLVPGVGY